MVGQHRCNVEALKREFSLKELKIRQSDEKSGKYALSGLIKAVVYYKIIRNINYQR